MINYNKRNVQALFMVVFLFVILLLTKGLHFSGWNMFPRFATIRYIGLFFVPILAFAIYNRAVRTSRMYHKKFVLYVFFASLFSYSLRNIFYDTGLGYGLENNLFVAFVFCSYIIFHYLKVPEKLLIKSLTFVGLIVLFIQVFQQIHPEMAVFSMYTEEMRQEMGLSQDYITGMRNGLYRFMPIAQHFPLFLLCYYFSKVLRKFSLKYLFLAFAFAASTYLMLTRMFMICAGICCLFIYIYQKNKKKSKFGTAIIAIVGVALLISYSDVLFSQLFSSQDSDIDYSSAARLDCIPFILYQAIQNPLLFIVGHGYPALLWRWGEKFGYWYNDVGVLGQIYPYGIIWAIVYFVTVYKLLIKRKNKIPIYIRAYILSLLCICFMMSSYGNSLDMTLLWCIILYISDLYISNSDKTEHNTI